MGEVIRKTKAGRFIGYYLRYMDADSRRKQRASHQPTAVLARRMLVEIEARIARGMVGIPEPAPLAPTVAELTERYLTEYNRPRIKDIAKYREYTGSALKRALPLLGAMRADVIQPADFGRLRDGLLQRYSPGSVRLTLDFYKALFNWAVKKKLLTVNPLHGVEPPPRQEEVEYLLREEVQALLVVLAERAAKSLDERMLCVCVQVALNVGLRKGEIFGLRWRDLDLETRRLTIARSFNTTPKSNKPRHLRLPLSLVPILREWRGYCPSTSSGLVFPRRKRDGSWDIAALGEMLALPSALSQAGIRPLSRPWHALRHSFASHYIMQGGNILALQKILGHSEIQMTMVYAHLAPDFLGEEMDRLKW